MMRGSAPHVTSLVRKSLPFLAVSLVHPWLAFAVAQDSTRLPQLATEVAFPNLRFDRPVAMAYPNDGGNLLFVVEQSGVIRSFPNDPRTSDSQVFLDIR